MDTGKKHSVSPIRVTMGANDMAEFLKDNFPSIELGTGKTNKGFEFTAKAAYGDVIRSINENGGYDEEMSSGTLSIYLDPENDTYVTIRMIDDDTTLFTIN